MIVLTGRHTYSRSSIGSVGATEVGGCLHEATFCINIIIIYLFLSRARTD